MHHRQELEAPWRRQIQGTSEFLLARVLTSSEFSFLFADAFCTGEPSLIACDAPANDEMETDIATETNFLGQAEGDKQSLQIFQP